MEERKSHTSCRCTQGCRTWNFQCLRDGVIEAEKGRFETGYRWRRWWRHDNQVSHHNVCRDRTWLLLCLVMLLPFLIRRYYNIFRFLLQCSCLASWPTLSYFQTHQEGYCDRWSVKPNKVVARAKCAITGFFPPKNTSFTAFYKDMTNTSTVEEGSSCCFRLVSSLWYNSHPTCSDE